jgi:hypothetical protein
MKRIITTAMLLVFFGLMSTHCYANKYDFLLKDPNFIKIVNIYDEHIKIRYTYKTYGEIILGSPDKMYDRMKRVKFDKEVLDFVKDNKESVYKYFATVYSSTMSRPPMSERKLRFVVDYIMAEPIIKNNARGSEKALGEIENSKMILNTLAGYRIYEKFKDDEFFKTLISDVFDDFLKNK